MDEKAIFIEALEHGDPHCRARFLDQACAGDAELRSQVDALLRKYDDAGSFLQAPAGAAYSLTIVDAPITESPGTEIGPYKLHEQIGEGGFGVVYLAEQTEPVKRRVALKIIKPGMDTKEIISRFEAERQALALMDHPGIARVLDAGATDSGRPYFVMELVKGISITDYCDQSHLATRDRLELFLQVCQAIQHAHQKGIIHRDVKPGNVLIAMQDGKPVPKVIDFGVAKAINQRLTDHTLMTRFAQVIGTPLYMSPEQAEMSPLDVDTRSDIYSLGVLLYELLTGTTPFERERLKEATFDEMRRIIREEEPLRPSARISTLGADGNTVAEKRRTEPRKLRQVVSGDLDWIAMKALEKDRTRRYETASSLAEDVERYLHDEPVQACPPSAAYRFRKFARRNKLALITTIGVAAAVIVLAVGASIAAVNFEQLASEKAILAQEKIDALDAATTEQLRAEGNLDLALEALDAVYLDAIGEQKLLGKPLSSPGQEAKGVDRPRSDLSEFEKELLRRGLSFYAEFARRNGNSSAAAAQTARAYYRVAMLQQALEQRSDAEEACRESINRYQTLIQNEPQNDRYHHELGQAFSALARIQPMWSDAEQIYKHASDAITAAIAINPEAAEYYHNRSSVLLALGNYRPAQHDAEKAAELAPDSVEYHLCAAILYAVDSPSQYKDINRAIAHCERALELEPNNASANGQFGAVLCYIDTPRALVHLSKAIALDPTLAGAYRTRAVIYMGSGDYEHALRDINEALRFEPESGGLYAKRADIYSALGRYEEAEKDLMAAEQLIPAGTQGVRSLYTSLANLHLRIGDYASAESDYTRCIERAPLVHWLYEARSIPRFHLGKYEDSLDDIATSCELWPGNGIPLVRIPSHDIATCPDENFRDGLLTLAADVMKNCRRANDWSRYAELLSACGQYADAESAYERVIDLGSTNADSPAHQEIVAIACNNLSWLLATCEDAELRNPTRAVELARKAVELAPENGGHWNTLGAAQYRVGEWSASIGSLTKSMEILGEESVGANAIFLAMAHWKLEQPEESRQWYDRASAWIEANGKEDAELLRFHAEATELLGLTKPAPEN